MEHVRWLTDPGVHQPTLLYAFTGWNDAGDAASAALRALVERWDATPIAEIDPEPFTDFATVRPHVRLADGQRTIVWPTVGIWSATAAGQDVVLVLGPEPALRWRSFCAQLVSVAERAGAGRSISLGALLADVPHTRPVRVIGTASDPDVLGKFDLRRSRYEGPTGIVGVLHDALSTAGLATASLWAAVPGYAAQVPSPKAAVALLERACAILGVPPPIERLRGPAGEYEARVAALIADDDDLTEYVSRLESLADDDTDDDDFGASDDPTGETPTTADVDPGELVAEVEQFLRERDPGS